jgi:ABC-type antimicrobial peptide transport system permease subunit
VALSVLITLIGGLLPARKAAHKDPVIALRAE